MKYYAITRFYDNGRSEGEILLEGEAGTESLHDGKCIEGVHCDEYCDIFNTYEKAEAFIADLVNA